MGDRAQSCLFRVITVLTCLSSGNQENVLDLAIKEEHKQHVVFGLARYSSIALNDAAGSAGSGAGPNANGQMLQQAAEGEQEEEDAQNDNLREVRRSAS